MCGCLACSITTAAGSRQQKSRRVCPMPDKDAQLGQSFSSSGPSKAKVGAFPPLPSQMPADQANPRLCVDASIQVISFGIHFIRDNICSCAKQHFLKDQIQQGVAKGEYAMFVREAKAVLAANIGFDSDVDASTAGTYIIAMICKHSCNPQINKRRH